MFLNRISTAINPYYVKFLKGGADFDAIIEDAGGVRFQSASDYSAKENIIDLPSATDAVKNLRPITFNYIWSPGQPRPGFIAHEVESVFPIAVTGEKDATETYGTYTDVDGNVETDVVEPSVIPAGASFVAEGTRPVYQGLDQTKLIPLLTKALQEALERIEVLEAQVNS